MKVLDGALLVLKDAGGALHGKEIAQRMVAEGLWIPKGKTPDVTVSSAIYADIKRQAHDSMFRKTGKQTFIHRDYCPDEE